MAEIIRFPGSGERKRKERLPLIKIPSLGDLYNEEAIMVGARSAHELKSYMTQAGRSLALEIFESALADARGKFILEKIRDPEARKKALVNLARFTYGVGHDIDSSCLMDWARDELVRGLGARKAALIVENVRFEKEIEKRNKEG